MCRMVGVVYRSKFPTFIFRDLQHVSQVGRIPGEKEPGHKDGWGLVAFDGGKPSYIGRSTRPIFLDQSFDAALGFAAKLSGPNIAIGHARAASKGGATLANTHPFIRNGIALGHNGTIRNFEPRTTGKPKGETDTERLLFLLSDRLDEKKDLAAALTSVIREDLGGREFSAAVLLVSDGNRLFGYRDYEKDDRAMYYDLRLAACEDCVVFYQETSMDQGKNTSQVAKGELVSVGKDLKVARRNML